MVWANKPRLGLYAVCVLYILFSIIPATERLGRDEFGQIRIPYELLGGDYTARYLKNGEYDRALSTVAKSYYLFWKYRPMNAPIVDEKDKRLFAEEEQKFGYVKPKRFEPDSAGALQWYQSRMIVPDPDRLYADGAGKPLLPQILSVPQLALLASVSSGKQLLNLQYSVAHHPLFFLARLAQFVAGLVSIVLIYSIVAREFGPEKAWLGAAVFAFLPVSVQYFPDIHNDSIMVPFLIGSAYLLFKGRPVKAGVLYGLALASKNAAIFLLPAVVIYYAWEAYVLHRENDGRAAKEYLIGNAKAFPIFLLTAVVVLTPFANPVSYAVEILTPITHRAFDPRGENVERFTLSGRTQGEEMEAAVGPGVRAAQRVVGVRHVLGFDSIFLLFAILALFLCLQVQKASLSRLSLAMLLMILPYGVVFQYNMSYRSLIFLPFFALLCVDVLDRRHLIGLAGLLFSATLLWTISSASTL